MLKPHLSVTGAAIFMAPFATALCIAALHARERITGRARALSLPRADEAHKGTDRASTRSVGISERAMIRSISWIGGQEPLAPLTGLAQPGHGRRRLVDEKGTGLSSNSASVLTGFLA
jgi:hypothetical protein